MKSSDWFDGESFVNVADLLSKKSDAEFCRSAIGRAYYSLFWAARTRALKAGVTFRELSKDVGGGTHRALIELYETKEEPDADAKKKRNPGWKPVGARIARALEKLRTLRQSADYDANNDAGVEDTSTVVQAIADAREAMALVHSVNWAKPKRN